MGLAAGSIGAIAPSTAQYAAAESVGAVHFGSATATLDTGSPIAPTGIAVPSFADVQSASVIVLRSPISGSGATAACGALCAAGEGGQVRRAEPNQEQSDRDLR